MRKENLLQSVILALFFCLVLARVCPAQETLTITTYYPSPDGSYNLLDAQQFRSSRIAVGNGTAMPATDGTIGFLNLAAPPGAAAASTGQVYFGTNPNGNFNNTISYSNGTEWVPIHSASLVPYNANNVPCIPTGSHVVGVLMDYTVNGVARTFAGASMEPCEANNGASAAFAALGVTPPNCLPVTGYIICH